MIIREKRDTALFAVVAVLLTSALIASVWVLAAKDLGGRRLLLDFTVYRRLTELTDLARAGDVQIEQFDSVLGFGTYAMDGKALLRRGSAPAELTALGPERRMLEYTVNSDTIILARMIGTEGPGRRMMGGPMFGGPMQGRGPLPEQLGGLGPIAAANAPAMAWLEYGLGSYRQGRIALLAASSVFSLVLAAVAALLVSLYARMSRYRDRALQDRELVELGNSARTIAHEIKNPLGVMRIQCALLKRTEPGAGPHVDIIEDEILRLSALADFFRTFTERYRDACEFAADIPADWAVMANEDRLRSAVDNLIANALEAQAQAGARGPEGNLEKVSVELRDESAGRHRFATLAVRDGGAGVAPELRDRLFQPFFTTKAQGSGLGLALAKKAVEAIGGTISYADGPGGGAVFSARLPIIKI